MQEKENEHINNCNVEQLAIKLHNHDLHAGVNVNFLKKQYGR